MSRSAHLVVGPLLLVAASCGSGTPGELESFGELFGSAASHRVFVDNTFGGTDVFDRVAVVSVIGQPSDDGIDIRFGAEDRELTAEERAAIVAALKPKAVTFVPAGTAPSSNGDTLEAVLSFTEPSGGGTSAVLTTSMVCGGTCGGGGAQRFVLTENGWQFVESVGGQWIS